MKIMRINTPSVAAAIFALRSNPDGADGIAELDLTVTAQGQLGTLFALLSALFAG
jgi:hypothetical protein